MPAKQRKIAVMGSRSVGKSSLAIQFVQARPSFFIYVDNCSLFLLLSYGSDPAYVSETFCEHVWFVKSFLQRIYSIDEESV
jgi:hypothetical protein